MWANFFGVGLVEAVDDLRLTNPASNEELLTRGRKYLVEHKYDLKELMRAILQSETYQRDSQPLPENKADERFYSRYYPRRLKAEVLLDAIAQVTAVPTDFKAATPDSRKPGAAIPEHQAGHSAARCATSIRTSSTTFGKPDRLITCECERSNEPSMTQVLHLYNGDTVNKKLASRGQRGGEGGRRNRQRARSSRNCIWPPCRACRRDDEEQTTCRRASRRQARRAAAGDRRPVLERADEPGVFV